MFELFKIKFCTKIKESISTSKLMDIMQIFTNLELKIINLFTNKFI